MEAPLSSSSRPQTDPPQPGDISAKCDNMEQETEETSDLTDSRVPPGDQSQLSADPSDVSQDVTMESPVTSGMFRAPMSIASSRSVIKSYSGTVAKAFHNTTSKEDKPEKIETREVKLQSYATPAEKITSESVPIPYKEPSWGGLCTQDYSFEVIKNGTVIDKIDLKTKSFYVFGRLPSCDVMMEHPSLSRYHIIIQYCATENSKHDIGWYLYDLDSTHGTWINKNKVKPRIYIRLRVGFVIKLGGSTRLHILQGPVEDMDEESDLSVSELQEQRQRHKMEAELLRQAETLAAESDELEQAKQDTGCSWGMDDADEEISSENPFALEAAPLNEDLYIEDPKKALRGYFEREGLDLPEYEVIDESRGRYKCQVELPIYAATGEPIVAEVTVSGKKKDAVAACALEACRILDRHGELRKSTHESRARKKKNWEENDYYGSDEDSYLDRTGDLDKKRLQRMKRLGKESEKKAETFESLTMKLEEIDKQISEIEAKINLSKQKSDSFLDEGLDVFDAYMESLKSGALDTKTRMKLKREVFDLKQEKSKLERLLKIAKPALPTVSMTTISKPVTASIFGKLKRGAGKLPVKVTKSENISEVGDTGADVEEEEEEDETMETNSPSTKNQPTQKINVSNTTENRSIDLELLLSDDKTCEDSPGQASSRHVKGPSLPELPDSDKKHTKDLAEMKTSVAPTLCQPETLPSSTLPAASTASSPSTRKRKRAQKSVNKTDSDYTDRAADPDYSVWVPPTGQSGDGKTSLNDKYGY